MHVSRDPGYDEPTVAFLKVSPLWGGWGGRPMRTIRAFGCGGQKRTRQKRRPFGYTRE